MASAVESGSVVSKQRQILIVEDDQNIALGLELNLQAEGYHVVVAGDGAEGLQLAQQNEFDVVILDVMLPKMNGFEVVRILREGGASVPVIMLSARGAESDKVMGLELGAEDYITKPFGLAELLARVKAVLRRGGPRARVEPLAHAEPVVHAGALVINSTMRQVRREGQVVTLTATEFDILWCLVEGAGQVLSREQILARVWGPSHKGTLRTIDNFLLQLRNKLERDPALPDHLLTVRGVGYRFQR